MTRAMRQTIRELHRLAEIERLARAVLEMSPEEQARWENGVRSCMATLVRTRGDAFTESQKDVRVLRMVERMRVQS